MSVSTTPSQPGEESDVEVAVAGRVMLVRRQGKIAFATPRRFVGKHPAVRPRGCDRRPRRIRGTFARGLDRRPRQGVQDPQGRALRRGRELGAPRRGAQSFGDKWEGVTDTETALSPSARSICGSTQKRRATLQLRSRVVALAATESLKTGDSSRSRLRSSIRS